MKKVALTVAVLALGLAACQKNEAANNEATADTNVENAAAVDTNAATDATANADVALNADVNATADANGVDVNATTNAQ